MVQGLYEKIGFRSVAPFGMFAPPQGYHIRGVQ
jgi:hypothetical protein